MLKNGAPGDDGRYSCRAVSAAGQASLDVDVQLISEVLQIKNKLMYVHIKSNAGSKAREIKQSFSIFSVAFLLCIFVLLFQLLS